MSKAEEKAEKAYPTWRNGIGDEFSSNSAYYGFIEGYREAEKELELTWYDMLEIETLLNLVRSSSQYKNGYKEVLKRFKDYKESKKK